MISTHVLDTTLGSPAAGIEVTLERLDETSWILLGSGVTNSDGRHVFDCEKKPGIFRLTFEIRPYLEKTTRDFFFLTAPVTFQITDTGRKYHVPLLLNPFGYSTYRGS